jgi:hypothetical protein
MGRFSTVSRIYFGESPFLLSAWLKWQKSTTDRDPLLRLKVSRVERKQQRTPFPFQPDNYNPMAAWVVKPEIRDDLIQCPLGR